MWRLLHRTSAMYLNSNREQRASVVLEMPLENAANW